MAIPSRWTYALPLLHLSVCLTVEFVDIQRGWEYLALADAPMSVLIIALSYNYHHTFLLFALLGTLWWYLLSRAADMLIRRWGKKGAAASASTEPSPDAK